MAPIGLLWAILLSTHYSSDEWLYFVDGSDGQLEHQSIGLCLLLDLGFLVLVRVSSFSPSVVDHWCRIIQLWWPACKPPQCITPKARYSPHFLASLPITLYLVDAFTFAASAVAAASTFRSLLGFAFPLFGSQMFEKLTVGWGCTVCTTTFVWAPFRNLSFFFLLSCWQGSPSSSASPFLYGYTSRAKKWGKTVSWRVELSSGIPL
jgi:hypothetical protein